MVLGDSGENGESMEILERLVEMEPSYLEAWIALGVAHGGVGQREKAIRAFRKAVTHDPDRSWIL